MNSDRKRSTVDVRANAVVRMERATFNLGGTPVLDNTDWEIAKGEHWAVVGPNGGGKTTLARALCREIPLVSGSVRFFFDSSDKNGHPEGRSWAAANEIVRLSSDTPESLLGRYGGYHQARWQSFESSESPMAAGLIETAESLQPVEHGNESRSLRVDAGSVIARLGISDLMDKRVMHLSNGEVRKLALARALLLRPRILILDDPFCGLDRAAKGGLRNLIENLLTGDRPQIVLITHRADEIPPGIGHCLYVDQMRVKERGKRERIKPIGQGGSDPVGVLPGGTSSGGLRDRAPVASSSSEPLVRMENVTIAYPGKSILRNINWRIYPGERWGVSGPNGAGKSTLLSLILADNPQAYANRIFLFGKRRGSGESIWEIKQRIGWVAPELQGYYPVRTTALDVVCSGFFDTIGLYRDCTVQQMEAAREQMRALGIDHLGDRRIAEISTGEKRLVLLARALVKQPELLILDEPCQGLDTTRRKQFIAIIDSLACRSGTSMIYVTHHPDEFPASITHMMILNRERETG